jgi:hypothetical protein
LIVAEKNATKNILDGQRYNSIPPSPSGERGYKYLNTFEIWPYKRMDFSEKGLIRGWTLARRA